MVLDGRSIRGNGRHAFGHPGGYCDLTIAGRRWISPDSRKAFHSEKASVRNDNKTPRECGRWLPRGGTRSGRGGKFTPRPLTNIAVSQATVKVIAMALVNAKATVVAISVVSVIASVIINVIAIVIVTAKASKTTER